MTRHTTPPAAPIARNYEMDDLFEVSGPARAKDLLGARSIPVDLLDPNPSQPRTTFDRAALEGLAASIRAHGVLQPLTVRKAGDRYQIGAGERRWQAAQLAGLAEVPCIERAMDDGQMRELALVENVMREDLSPLDLARALQQMMDVFGLSARALSERLGKNHGYVVDKLRIARDPRIAAAVEDGTLGATVALALAALDDEATRTGLLARATQGERIKVKDVQAARDQAVSVKPTARPSAPSHPNQHDEHDRAAGLSPTTNPGPSLADVSVKPTEASPRAGVSPAPILSPTVPVSVKPTEDREWRDRLDQPTIDPLPASTPQTIVTRPPAEGSIEGVGEVINPGYIRLHDLRIIQLHAGRDGEPRHLDTADRATVLRILRADLAWLEDIDRRATREASAHD